MSEQLRSDGKQGANPVLVVVRESLSEGDLYDSLLEDGDPATIPATIGLLSLGIGFANVEELQDDTTLSELFNSTNPDLLALEVALFLICQSEKALNQKTVDNVVANLTIKSTSKVALAGYLRGARRYIHGLYARYYDQVNLDSYVDQACSKYSREKALPSAALASRLLECIGSINFDKGEPIPINTRNQMLLGVHAMKTFQKSMPKFHQSLDNLLSCFT